MRSFCRSALVRVVSALGLGLVLSSAGGASAQSRPAFAPPGRGQAGLAIGADARGVLRAKSCAAEPCSIDGGVDLGLPHELAGQVARARLAVVGIGSGRRAIVVTVPAPGGRAFEAVVVGPLGGGTPKIVFAGMTGLAEGSDGVRQGRSVTIFEPDESGARAVVVGTEREDINLCGRRAVLAPEALNPADLTLRPARVQRLSPREREQAIRLQAERVQGEVGAGAGRVLSALGASSALGAPQLLTDGRADTAWTENRGGDGRGEFVVVGAPRDLPISAFDVVLTAPGPKPDPANVPRELWLATRTRVYHVLFPAEAASEAGARFRVKLPKPEQTDCIAPVLESAFAERAGALVSLAELGVTSEFEGATPAALVGALAGGGERALAAAAVLRGLGAPGFQELAVRFDSLDERGKRVALDVMDSAECAVSVPVYLSALAGPIEPHRLHAQSRLRRCGRVSAEGLGQRIAGARGEQLTRFANELALVAPERAAAELTRALPRRTAADRRALRVALARAVAAPEAAASVRQLLADAALPPVARLDLLRALGSRAPGFLPEAGAAVASLAADPSFRTRYLLIAPASVLAASDASARDFLMRSLGPQSAADGWIRQRALELAPREPARAPAFIAALTDENVRVRETAAHALGEGRFAAAGPNLVNVLVDDAWPVVRRASAKALGALPAEARGNEALSDALSDEAPSVRAASAESLGARRVTTAAEALRDRLEDPREHFEVRRASAAALGALCDRDSTDTLWTLVRRVDDPMATVEERALGEASLAALARIAPPDLDEKLAPLRRGQARKAVERALARTATQRCR